MSSAPPDVFGATNETPLRSSIRDSLAEWTKCALGPLDQEPAAHHQVLIHELEDISTGANTRLIVLMPPGSAKSTYAKEYVDARVFRLGDTMTGPLILSGDPTTALEATTKEYTDGQFAKSLPAAGGTMTGPLTLAANPTSTLQAAPRQYVDDQVATALPLTGGSLSGALLLAGNPSGMMQAATKQYVDFQFATALPLSGGTLTGPVSIDNTISFSGASSFQSSVSMSAGLTISSGTLVAEGSASIAGSLSVGGGTIGLPTYAVAALPLCTVGALAYATNGRKIGEAAGVGTGVLVAGGSVGQWISVMSGTAVLA